MQKGLLEGFSIVAAVIMFGNMIALNAFADNENQSDKQQTNSEETTSDTSWTEETYNVYLTLTEAMNNGTSTGMVSVVPSGNMYKFAVATEGGTTPEGTSTNQNKDTGDALPSSISFLTTGSFSVTDKEPKDTTKYYLHSVENDKYLIPYSKVTTKTHTFSDHAYTVTIEDKYIFVADEDYIKGINDSHKEMTGQVELRPLDESTKARLAEIRAELEMRKEDNGLLYNILNVARCVAGIVCFLYAICLVSAYFIDVMCVLPDDIRPFTLVTFGKNWAVPMESSVNDFFATSAYAAKSKGITFAGLMIWAGLLIVGGVLLLTINWVSVGYTFYYFIKG